MQRNVTQPVTNYSDICWAALDQVLDSKTSDETSPPGGFLGASAIAQSPKGEQSYYLGHYASRGDGRVP